MLHRRFIYRQLVSAKKQSAIFIICVALSMVTLVALRGFGESINRTLLADARQLQAGDIILRSSYELSQPLRDAVATMVEQGLVEATRIYRFYSIARVTTEDNSLLAELKVVESGYPFYGQVELQSGRPFHEVLKFGQVIVEQVLLDRLGLQVGDQLRLGEATLTIADVVIREPDRPVNFFAFGPRIFVTAQDLASLGLVKEGSRVTYITLLKAKNSRDVDALAAQLKAVAIEDQERVETYRTAQSGVKRFFDNFLFYLSLVGIFTLLLAGIGIQSSLTAFLREKEPTIAIVKTMGATNRYLLTNYLAVVAGFGLIGTLAGLSGGFLLAEFFPILFRNFLPPDVALSISWRVILESLLLGFFVVGSFTFLPLSWLREVKPGSVFRKEMPPQKRSRPYYLTVAVIFLFFTGMVLWQLDDLKVGLYFVFGAAGLILITGLLAELVLFGLKRSRLKSLAARQALRGLFRPRNATRSIIITLAASLAVLFTIYLIERNLDTTFVEAYPDDAPNVFFIDIQPDQVEAFAKTLGMKADFIPIIRATISTINDQPIDREAERERAGDNLARTFTLTYRDHLLDGEGLSAGQSLFRADWAEAQVSVLDEMVELGHFKVGDTIAFKIQGVLLKARVASIRTRTDEAVEPLFDFVLREKDLKSAPQTIFSAVRVGKQAIPALQNKMVAAFPNISVIDVTAAIATFADVARKISNIIRFFTLFSLIAGLLIIVSSVFATRFARIQEAVYYKVLGAKGRFVLQVFTLENLFLGFISAALALFLSQIASWLISVQVLEIDYSPFIGPSLVLIGLTMLLVTTVGLLASISILRQRPIIFLREQTEE